MKKCVFLDRDGTLNVCGAHYVYKPEDFVLYPDALEALKIMKGEGFLVILITNQGGVAKGEYGIEDVDKTNAEMFRQCGDLIDDVYYNPYHEVQTRSFARKPDSLMFEKAISKYNINPALSWMVGDMDRDLIPAKKLGITSVLVEGRMEYPEADYSVESLKQAAELIRDSKK